MTNDDVIHHLVATLPLVMWHHKSSLWLGMVRYVVAGSGCFICCLVGTSLTVMWHPAIHCIDMAGGGCGVMGVDGGSCWW